MAPIFRTCCGFLQIHGACKVTNPRLYIKTSLNVGSKYLSRSPVLQVREFITNATNVISEFRNEIYKLKLKNFKVTLSLVALISDRCYVSRKCSDQKYRQVHFEMRSFVLMSMNTY